MLEDPDTTAGDAGEAPDEGERNAAQHDPLPDPDAEPAPKELTDDEA
jgi:hypothetical protein